MDQIQRMTASADGSASDTVWYFSYGSNLDPERFRARVCDFLDRQQAVLHDYALRFSSEVTSEGGGGAIIQTSPGGTVYGGVYRIERAQIDKMDEVELGSGKNPEDRGMLAEGYFADVLVIDRDSIRGVATFDDPFHYAEGMRFVFVNGEAVVAEGELTEALPGRAIRGKGWSATAGR